MRGGRTRAAFLVSSIGILAVMTVGAMSGIAAAVSGGGYNPNQNDCQWNNDAWATPQGEQYPGCHSIALNVETGGTTNGDADSDNTRFVEYGDNQNPVDPNSQGTPTELSLGYPGDTGAPHAGCLAANTDGTTGGPAPAGTPPTSSANAENEAAANNWGCGNNPNGTGFEADYDLYALYCPLVASAEPCEDPSYASEPATFTPDTGSAQALTDIVTQGLVVYYGMDDNTDNTEHDGFDGLDSTNGAINGPSDGGGMILSLEPQWLLAPTTPTVTNPEGLANYSGGFCADSICFEGSTQQQTDYYGCYDPSNPNDATWEASGTDGATNPENDTNDDQCASGVPENTNTYENNTPQSTEESQYCNSGGPDGNPPAPVDSGTEWPCYTNTNGTSNDTSDQPGCASAGAPNPNGTDECGGANAYRQDTPQQVNSEPGIQTFEDPDPQRSPALPFGTPGIYVGTCGVFVNDGTTYEPGLTGTLTDGMLSLDPGYLVETPGCD